MAKLILSLDNTLLSEYSLNQERLTIGRRPSNDVHIDNLAVSGEHAAIIQMGKDFYIEDLNSTNGTLVNSKVVKKHLLQHADVIEFGKYQLKYINEASLANIGMGGGEEDFEKTMMIRPSAMKAMEQPKLTPAVATTRSSPPAPTLAPSSSSATPRPATPVPTFSSVKPASAPPSASAPINMPMPGTNGEITGRIQVLNGSSSGRELILNKALTTLGKPGVQVAVITKRPNGYFITHVEGQTFPIVNGTSTGAQAFALSDHDVIELAGVKMEFYLGKP
ncbi:MAG: FHA domain-containing protein [Methylotenera sp.]|nr:FHA domain-containing protein [Methylotenera sp.]